MTGRPRSNQAALARVIRQLQREDRYEGAAVVVTVLAATSARLLDEVMAPDSSVPADAKAAAVRAHAIACDWLVRVAGPVERDTFGELLSALARPSAPDDGGRWR